MIPLVSTESQFRPANINCNACNPEVWLTYLLGLIDNIRFPNLQKKAPNEGQFWYFRAFSHASQFNSLISHFSVNLGRKRYPLNLIGKLTKFCD